MDELKPCPFCGGEAEYYSDCDMVKVHCSVCGANTSGWFDEPEEATADWNRRAVVGDKALTMERLKKMGNRQTPQWVWLEILGAGDKHQSGYYRAQFDYTRGRAFCCGYPGQSYSWNYADYGKTWLAYDHKPEKE